MDLTPNCSHKVRSMKLSEVRQYAGALTVPFTRKCRAQLLRKQTPHCNPPSVKLYTWHNAVRQLPFSWATAKPRLVHRIVGQRSVLRHSRDHVPIAPEFSGLWVSPGCIWHFAWHLVMRGLDTAVWPWKNPSHEPLLHCSWAKLKATYSFEVNLQNVDDLCPWGSSPSADPALGF